MIIHLFTLLFTGLKLTNYINWEWWLVLSPSLIAILYIIIVILFITFKKK